MLKLVDLICEFSEPSACQVGCLCNPCARVLFIELAKLE